MSEVGDNVLFFMRGVFPGVRDFFCFNSYLLVCCLHFCVYPTFSKDDKRR